uniref:Uncharacterized protein n=1 Tax=Araucaria cunninghamii TaxID=56994 RepID=A0A0D6R1C6_ARACU
MRNEGGARSRGRSRKSGFFPTSFRVISSYLKTVSGNASSIASTVCTAGASVASSVSRGEEDREREQVQWAGFDKLELGTGNAHHVLLLTYKNGFQVWDIESAENVHELVSKRDGAVAFLRLQPEPITMLPDVECFQDSRPLLLVATVDQTFCEGNLQEGFGSGYNGEGGSPPPTESSFPVPTVIQFYSFRSHAYVHILKFRSAIYGVRCSSNIVAVALATQIHCYDAATLQSKFSVLTYPIPQGGPGPVDVNIGYGPMDVGTRWLAYAANHAVVQNTGRASPQHLSPSPGVSPSTSPANGSLVAHYAKESSKQIAAGIMTIGDIGYKKLTRYYSELLPDDSSSPRSGSTNWKYNSNGFAGHAYELEHAGTVVVRDFVSKSVVAQFRAHTSPISALCFDPTGTLLVTASVHGHNLNVYRIMAHATDSGLRPVGIDLNTSYVHLYKLNRGLTNAVIQDISFSNDSHWIAVSSLKGTSHLFAISPFGGVVGPHTHGDGNLNGSMRYGLAPSFMSPWWSNSEPFKMNQQALPAPPPPINLSVVSRIKNGNGAWHNPVSSATAVATGKMKFPAVAALFHNSSGCSVQRDQGNSISKDQLWVFSSSGHLIRYVLHTAGHEAVSCSSTGMGVRTCGPSQEHDFKVLVDPLEKWDVARKLNWVEREENVDNLSHEIVSGGGPPRSLEGCRYETAVTDPTTNERREKEGRVAEEKHREYMSNAEMQTHQRWPPLWAKSEIYFHAMMSKSTNEERSDVVGPGGEIYIEKIPTRAVEARKTDLVPVFEPYQTFKNLQGERDPISEAYSVVSPLQVHWMKDECIQENMDLDPLQISSSESSYGSQGEAHPDSEGHMQAMLHLNSVSEHHLEHGPTSSDVEEISRSLQKLNLPNQEVNGKCHAQMGILVSNGLLPMDVPMSGKGIVLNRQILEEVLEVTGSSKSFPMQEIGMGKKQPPKHNVVGHAMVISGEKIVNDRVSQGGLLMKSHTTCNGDSSSSDTSDTNHWILGSKGETDSFSPKLYSTSIPMDSVNSDCRSHVENKLLGTKVLDKRDSFVSIKVTELDRTITSHKMEQDEDGWEGGIFPFCEED